MSKKKYEIKTYAKLNLGLEIVGKRPNGYHELETIFQTIDFFDEMKITIDLIGKGISMTCNKKYIPTDKRNIIFQACELFQKKTGKEFLIHIDLIKNVPVGGGLGGGSSNAAGILQFLNEIFNAKLTFDELSEIGLQLGADVPYFLLGGTVFATGIGEKLEKMSELEANGIIYMPDSSVNTKNAYSMLDFESFKNKLFNMRNIKDDINGEKFKFSPNVLFNRFEDVVFKEYPEIFDAYNNLRAENVFSEIRMTGSGAVLYGLFEDEDKLKYWYEKNNLDKKKIKKIKFLKKSLEFL